MNREKVADLVLLFWSVVLLAYAWVVVTVRALWKFVRGEKAE
jgi:hypothetical protein